MARRVWIIPSTKQEIIDKHTPIINPLKGKQRVAMTNAMLQEIKAAQRIAVGAALADAENNGCSEIVWGIPPALKNILRGKKLPLAYEEPEILLGPEPRDLEVEIDDLKARVEKLEDA